ncbi:hypothetical protein [Streptomyces sp. NBC_01373]|uniref:hypothetical protein n=1 Tax=Streptomyces sp. NBC_01373 TaxID=2903843 RepID=UPI002255E33A|nr:hypothetical protein [Streptomyces sp. NBC_01373]MCX4704439.1 hypothetical protein [Streptomyces sp. NBC_01373]
MTSPHEPTEPDAAPEGDAGDTARSGHKRHSTPAGIARSTVSAVLIVLTCILVPITLLTVWVHGIALDTDQYVETVSPLASEPAIEDAAVKRITHAADVRVDGPGLQAQGLPPRARTP